MKAKIYHNPRCSKSRATLALLEEHNIDHDVIAYLDSPPQKNTLRALLRKLDLPVQDIVRFNEAEFKASGLTREASEDQLLELIVEHPKVLQRPIVEYGSNARIGRPPEQVLELFE